jgi:cytochrome c peroxidase
MARYQCGARLGAGEVDQIVAFLHALTGPLPGAYIAQDADAAAGPPSARPNDTTEPRP